MQKNDAFSLKLLVGGNTQITNVRHPIELYGQTQIAKKQKKPNAYEHLFINISTISMS